MGWSWCLYVNNAFALAATAGALAWVPRHRRPTSNDRGRIDLAGTVSVVIGLLALVYGAAQAESSGWASLATVGLLSIGIVSLTVFVLIERRVEHPLLPMRILTDRSRAGSRLALALSNVGIFAVFLFLTFFMQETLGLSPLMTGTAFIAVVLAITVAAAPVAPPMLTRRGPRRPIVLGAVLGAAGLAWFARLDPTSSYPAGILPGAVLVGLGIGLVFGSATAAATEGVEDADSGVGSAVVNAVQQLGGALGTALLTTLATQRVTHAASSGGGTDAGAAAAAVEGYGLAFAAAAIFLVMAAACAALVPSAPATSDGSRS